MSGDLDKAYALCSDMMMVWSCLDPSWLQHGLCMGVGLLPSRILARFLGSLSLPFALHRHIFLEFGENVFLGELGLRRFVACFPLVEIQSPGVVLTVTNYSRIMFLWQYNPPQILGASNLFASISGNYVQSTVLVVALQLTCLWFLVLFSLSLLRVS